MRAHEAGDSIPPALAALTPARAGCSEGRSSVLLNRARARCIERTRAGKDGERVRVSEIERRKRERAECELLLSN